MNQSARFYFNFNGYFKQPFFHKLILLGIFLMSENVIAQNFFNQNNTINYSTLGKNSKILQCDLDYDNDLDFLHFLHKTDNGNGTFDTLFFNRNICDKISPIFANNNYRFLDVTINGTNGNFLGINALLATTKFDFVFYDFDADGDLDFIRSKNDTIDFYQNNGSFPNYTFGNTPLFSLDLANKNVGQIELEDLNNDNKLDLIVLSENIYIYLNIGTAQLPNFSSLPQDSILLNTLDFEFTNIQLADLDNDDLRDLAILGNESLLWNDTLYKQPKIIFYKNQFNNLSKVPQLFLQISPYKNSIKYQGNDRTPYNLYLFDSDNDQDLDLYSSWGANNSAFQNLSINQNLQNNKNEILGAVSIDKDNDGIFYETSDDFIAEDDSIQKVNESGMPYFFHFFRNTPRLQNLNLKIQTLSQTAILNTNNQFRAYPENGTYIITAPTLRNFTVSEGVKLININETENPNPVVEFLYKPIMNRKDLSVTLLGLPPIPGQINYKMLTYRNLGYTKQNGIVKYKLGNGETFIKSTPPPSSINGDTYSWNFSDLELFERRKITLSIQLDQNILVGSEIKSFAEILLSNGNDFFKKDNKDTLVQETVSSLNSFGKIEFPSGDTNGIFTDLSIPHEFTIYFQNTNSTAINSVQIADTLDTDFDFNTLQVIESSHPIAMENKNNKVLRWLVDANLPSANSDPVNSRGFIKYKITPKTNTPLGTTFTNKASICLNCAINITNQTSSIYDVISGIFDHLHQKELELNAYPNPAGNEINFLFKNPFKQPFTLKIFSINGSEILSTTSSNEIININTIQFTNGLYLYTIESESSFGKGKFVKE
jgi:hypothetical protein